ncbi:HNH endonuclease [Lusitaniella coriacea LEGE 07157]|uniref:HNH endonuclease n=1 Tax=Lusitaniella coriacea LEGE 07157 TaxID=945747 RepID=A0A8J7DYI8_9CYAN|nr:HNH endonuclease signature motif containing protein [Lusitaniella coriacea]MBE9116051.1 HNH endonuclease [Lusitaniella coriacea LEGE 07157]
MSRRKIPTAIQEQVRQRAKELCEYCHASERWQYVRFNIEHIIPRDRGGTDDLENLALACFHCNRRKSNKISAIDPESGVEVSLFNPRENLWSEHFVWSKDGLYIQALTTTGFVTIEVLSLNRDRAIAIRAADREIGRHPPSNDPIATK